MFYLFASAIGTVIPESSAATIPAGTVSYYEHSTRNRILYAQGELAGERTSQGIVILDFGRPAASGPFYGTMDYDNAFVSLDAISKAVESYVRGYFRSAPTYAKLDVALGTNNSCGTDQPCGGAICGCIDEPPSFGAWGYELAQTVLSLNAWAVSYRQLNHLSDDVRVVAGDDAEPGYDPGFSNTYALLAGYARGVGGSYPPMVDYGSADAHYWTQAQLLQVAYGFAPDVPMPEIYSRRQLAEWSSLLRYGMKQKRAVTVFGVLIDPKGFPKYAPPVAYVRMSAATRTITGQQSIEWLSAISY